MTFKIKEGLSVNGNQLSDSNRNLTANSLQVAAGTGSSSTTTGTLLVTGGVGVTENISIGGIVRISGATAGTTILKSTDTASGTLTLPAATDTLVAKSTTDVFANKTINLSNNTLSGTLAQFNSALSDADFVSIAGVETLTNKTLIGSSTLIQDVTDATKNVKFNVAAVATGTTQTLSFPNASGTIALTNNTLSAFAATTSAQLASVITDETGTGLLVFGTSPTFSTSILTNSTSFDVLNTTATTINFGGAATALTVGATTGTLTLRNPTVVGSNATQTLWDTTATTINFGGAATAVNIGATTGTLTLRNATVVGSNTTQNLWNTTATTINLGGAATALTVGATTGTLTLRNATVVGSNATQTLWDTTATTINFGGAATAVNIGATTGTLTLRNPTVVGSSATQNLWNTTATTINLGGAATAVNIGASTGTVLVNNNLTVAGNLTVNGTTTTVNSTTVTVDDPVITLGGDTAPTTDDSKDRGVEYRWFDGISAKVGFFGFDNSTRKFTFIPDAVNTSETFSGTKGVIDANLEWNDVLNKPDPTVTVTLTGDVTGSGYVTLTDLTDGTISFATTISPDSVVLGTDTTGNYVADVTAGSYILKTGTASEGQNPTIAVDATSANTASKVVARDASGNFSANIITAALSGNATTATTLQTARTINGVSFNGSANITTPGYYNIIAKDNRIVKPADLSNYTFGAYFSTQEGLNGTVGDIYGDFLALNSWADAFGGKVNGLFFNKSVQTIQHYQAAYGAATWGTPKTLAYTDSNITGNAATATKLATARNINGVAFDGSANITIADSTKLPLTGGTLTGTLNTKAPIYEATLTDIGYGNDAPIKVPELTFANGAVGYMPMIHGSTVTTDSGYRIQGSLGLYRGSNTWANGGFYLAVGGNDNYPTESFYFKTGGILDHSSGNITVKGTLSFPNDSGGVQGTMGTSDSYRIVGRSTAADAGYLEIATADNGSEPIYVRQYTGTYTTLTRTATILDGSGNTQFPGTVTATTFSGALTGNASTATKLQTARTLAISGDATGSASFDGSSNATIAVTIANKDVANGIPTLDASGLIKSSQLPSYVDDVLEYANLAAFPATGETSKIYVALDTNRIYRWSGSVYVEISGSALADAAIKLYTARTINGVAFDGTADITIADNTKLPLTGGTLTGELVITSTTVNPSLSIGRSNGTESTPFIDFNSGATLVDYDSRIIASGGNGVRGSGTLTYTAGSHKFEGNVTMVTGSFIGPLTGNADTATKLQTARTINGVAFDGSANITVTANTPNSHVIKFDTGTTEGTDLYTFNGSASKTVNITAGANITLTKTAGNVTISSSVSSVDWATVQNKPDPTITVELTGGVTGSGQVTLTDLTSGTLTIPTVVSATPTGPVELGTGTNGNYVASITNGSYITGANGGSEGAALTLAVDATSVNTANKVVARDASGNFSAGTVTVDTLMVDTVLCNTATATTTSTAQFALAAFIASSYTSGEIIIQATQGSSRQITKLLVIHDGTAAYATEFGTIATGLSLFTADVDFSTGNVRLLITPKSATSTSFKAFYTLIGA